MHRFLLLVAAAASMNGSAVAPAAERPNVLFLFTDDQRADTIAALGNEHIHTPNLDRLVRSGFVFDNAYCMGSTMPAVCNPSRHMVLSGRSLFRYDPQAQDGTLGDTFRQAGYETFHLSKRGNEARVYHTAFEHSGYLDDRQERTSGHHGRTAADRTIAFLESRDRRRPFLAYVGFAGPHDPRAAADEWMSRYDRERIPLPANYRPFHPFNNGELLVRDEQLAPWPRTEAVVREHLHDYYACITSIDHHIGRILAALRETGDIDNTLIVFSSDHGLAVGSHGLFGKQSLYEHSMNSPLIFAGPGVPQGQSAAFAYLFDIFPTLCELAGIDAPAGIEGRSLARIIRGEQDGVRDVVFLAYRDVMRAVRRGNWKLIRYPQVDVTQLFHLADDPHELQNLAGDPQHAERVSDMLRLLAQQQREHGDELPLMVDSPQPATIDVETFFSAPPVSGKPRR
jgi:arylsulfatase A-like enzyme